MAARLSVLSAFTIAVGFVQDAKAHEPPFGTGVYASDAGLVLRMSRGLVLRSSERPEYRLLCNEALGVAEYDSPSVLVRADGSLLVGTSTGLRHVSADGCDIELAHALADTRISALVAAPEDSAHVYAATDAGFFESRDHGERFDQVDEHVFESLEVPAGTHDVVFAAGTLPSPPGHMRPYIARWGRAEPLALQELALEPGEFGVALLGSDAEHVVAVARAYLGTQSPDRFLVSADGARSWQNPRSAPSIAAFAVDARTGAWIVGDATGLWRTSATGRQPAQLGAAAISCLSRAGSQLFICDGAGGQGGVSVSADGGESARSLLRWNQVAGLVACGAEAPSVQQCQSAWDDWTRELPPELALEEESPADADAGMPPAQATPRSCAAIGGSAATGSTLWLMLLLSIVVRLLLRHPAMRSSMTKILHTVVLALGLLSSCSKDSNSSEAGTTRSDAGPRSRGDAGAQVEQNLLEDAAMSGAPDSGQAVPSDAGTESASAGGRSGTGGEPHTNAGTSGQPASPIADAGASPSEPDDDSGSGELCSTCGGCEQVIEVVSTMHTNNPVTYPDPPPTSGPHNPCWGRWGVHDEPLAAERWVHNLEHGGVVFLYNCPDGCDTEVAAIKQLNRNRHRTILTSYANLPTRFGVVSWGHRLLSDCFDLGTFDAFYMRNFDHGPESNANPPNPSCPP